MKAKAYIVHRAMCEPVLEWSRPKNCLFFEPLYASTQAQPAQQEPVAYMDVCEKGQMSDLRFWSEPDNRHQVPLYTSPPASKPLTDEQITEYFKENVDTGSLLSFADGVRFAEAAHGIKGDA